MKKALRELQFEIEVSELLMESTKLTSVNPFGPKTEFSDLFKEIVLPYKGLIPVETMQYLIDKLEIDTDD